MKHKFLKKTCIISGIIFIIAGLAGSAFIWHMVQFTRTPFSSSTVKVPEPNKIIFHINPGESLLKISKNLEHEKIIKSSLLFQLYTRFTGDAGRLKAGEYTLSASMPPEKILQLIVKGKVKLYKLTIPEGLTIKETAKLVEKADFGTEENFISAARDKKFAKKMGIKADSFEGYLFPETYFFPKNATAKDIIIKMVKRFNIVFTPQWKNRGKEIGLSLHKIVILASIIEKETGDASERPIISSVFHNRLKKGMRLESDPTVIYGIPDFNGNITRKDLRTITPYNTYKIKGFPLGPIANPGKMSLKAALFPAETNYIFFVAKKDTTHKFSKNIREHNRAVRKYQLNH
ncbi:MAG: endolytic transglycosylase MltG [Thermodesulfobacteriota bacterium]|nr:endolytic transglycosylase MltG [Thermodesulfobacteriota bacterium]